MKRAPFLQRLALFCVTAAATTVLVPTHGGNAESRSVFRADLDRVFERSWQPTDTSGGESIDAEG